MSHAALVLTGCLLCPGAGESRAAAPPVPGQIQFVYHQRCVFVTMRAGPGEELLFLLDTGANTSALDTRVARRLKLPVTGQGQVEGTTGVRTVEQVRLDRLSAGDAVVEGLTPTTQDLGGSLAPPGRRVDGILGTDFLRRFALTVDYQQKTLRFDPKQAAAGPGFVTIPFKLDQGIPRIEATLHQGTRADLRIDTGASLFETTDVYVNIPEVTWAALTAADPKLTVRSYLKGGGTGGEVRLPVSRLEQLTIGGLTVARPFVIVQPKAGYFARPDAVGFVSNNLLEKYSPVTFNFPANTLVFRPK